jgi:hypothetical protein
MDPCRGLQRTVRLLCGLVLCSSHPAWPDSGGTGGDSHVRITSERREVARRADIEQAECQKRFMVTACLDDVQSRRRQALQDLREREMRLDDEERKERAVRRQAEVARRQLDEGARPASTAAEPQTVKPHATPASGPWSRRAPASDSASAVRAAERAEAARHRREDAAERQDRVVRRQLDRAASGKTDDPLPVPVAASTPGR